MIDYVTCVVAPALFIHEFFLLPHRYNISLIGVFLILTSSLYVMSNKNILTPDNYFAGFPSMWNLVANVLWVLQSRQWVNVLVIGILVVVSFVPVKFIHPIRVRDFRRVTIPVLVVWLLSIIYVTWIIEDVTFGPVTIGLPTNAEVAQAIIYIGLVWILGVGFWRTIHGPFRQTVPASAVST
jgi:phosphatidylcholine synthase